MFSDYVLEGKVLEKGGLRKARLRLFVALLLGERIVEQIISMPLTCWRWSWSVRWSSDSCGPFGYWMGTRDGILFGLGYAIPYCFSCCSHPWTQLVDGTVGEELLMVVRGEHVVAGPALGL